METIVTGLSKLQTEIWLAAISLSALFVFFKILTDKFWPHSTSYLHRRNCKEYKKLKKRYLQGKLAYRDFEHLRRRI